MWEFYMGVCTLIISAIIVFIGIVTLTGIFATGYNVITRRARHFNEYLERRRKDKGDL